MKEFFKKIKLVDCLTTELEMEKSEFISKFKDHVDDGSTDLFSDIFDIFSLSKNEYKGQVGFDEFKIKRRRRFFDMNMNLAVAIGRYSQERDKLIIETEINGFSGMMIPFFLFGIVFYIILIGAFFFDDNFEGGMSVIAIPFIILHAFFMFGLPYLLMRRSTKRMKHELEREFYYFTKK